MKIQRAIKRFPTENGSGQETVPAADLLAQAANFVRPHLDGSTLLCERVQALWAAVVAARDFGANDVIESEFFQLARDTGLFADLGRHADADLRHVIRWAIRNQNPFR
jgi:hypothetical protein